MFKSKKPTGKFTARDYEQLGRQLTNLFDELKPNRAALYRSTFIKGAIGGLAGIVGATIGIALLLWLLSLFSEVPILGHFVESVKHTLQSHR